MIKSVESAQRPTMVASATISIGGQSKIMYEYLDRNGVTPRIIASNGKDNFGYNPSKYNIIQTR